MPSYNYGRFLPAAIDSVLAQSYDELELLVIDNGSSDGSYEIAQEYAQRDKRVRVLTHPDHRNHGVNASLNLGLAEARGGYFGLLPADDVCLPAGLERRVTRLDAEPEASFVYGTAAFVEEDGERTGQIGGRAPDEMLGFDATGDLVQSLLFHDFVPGASTLVRRDALAAIGGFSDGVYFNDWYVTIRLLCRGRCVFVGGDPVVGYRLHERHRSEDNRAADRPRRLELFRALWHESGSAEDHLGAPRIRALVALQRAVHAYRLDEQDEARAAIVDALDADPALRTDAGYLAWWLDPRHGEWTLSLPADQNPPFLAALSTPSRRPEDALALGSDVASFAHFVLDAAKHTLSAETRALVAWTVVAEQLEAMGARPEPRLVLSFLLRAARRPALVRLRPFAKAALCAAGIWPLAAELRRRITIAS